MTQLLSIARWTTSIVAAIGIAFGSPKGNAAYEDFENLPLGPVPAGVDFEMPASNLYRWAGYWRVTGQGGAEIVTGPGGSGKALLLHGPAQLTAFLANGVRGEVGGSMILAADPRIFVSDGSGNYLTTSLRLLLPTNFLTLTLFRERPGGIPGVPTVTEDVSVYNLATGKYAGRRFQAPPSTLDLTYVKGDGEYNGYNGIAIGVGKPDPPIPPGPAGSPLDAILIDNLIVHHTAEPSSGALALTGMAFSWILKRRGHGNRSRLN